MFSRRKPENRRLERDFVLDVKMRSQQVKSRRARAISFFVLGCLIVGLTLTVMWRGTEWGLNRLVFQNPAFAVFSVEANTDGVLPVEKLRQWSGVRVGDNLFSIDLARIRRDMELAPLIESVSVERVLPHTVRIRVSERRPVAQVVLPRPGIQPGQTELTIYYLDGTGHVMLPLEGMAREKWIRAYGDSLPTILGINPVDLRPGRTVDSAKALAALRLVEAFQHSQMFGLTDIRTIDITGPEILQITTTEGADVTFALDSLAGQFNRWRRIHDEGARLGRAISSVDLSISNNIPVRWLEASAVPARANKTPPSPKPLKKHV